MRKLISILAMATITSCNGADIIDDFGHFPFYLDLKVENGASGTTSSRDVDVIGFSGAICGDAVNSLTFTQEKTSTDGRIAKLIDFPPVPMTVCVSLRIHGDAAYRDSTVSGFVVALGEQPPDTIRTTIRLTLK
jgi:hypothetical protein